MNVTPLMRPLTWIGPAISASHRCFVPATWAVLCLVLQLGIAAAQDRPRAGRLAVKLSIDPHWFDDDRQLWYRNDLHDGVREFVLVDVEQGTRAAAFDHQQLADSLREAGVEEVQADRLPITSLAFDLANDEVRFRLNGRPFAFIRGEGTLRELEPEEAGSLATQTSRDVEVRRTLETGPETSIAFINRRDADVELFWVDQGGERRGYGVVGAGQTRQQHTYAGHLWAVANPEGETLGFFRASADPDAVALTADMMPLPDRRRERRGRRDAPDEHVSPDGQWRASIEDGNVVIRNRSDDQAIELSTDGSDDAPYESLHWSPDSRSLVSLRVEPVETKPVYRVESSPDRGGRAVLHTSPYQLPGDPMTAYELTVFNVVEQTQSRPFSEKFDFGRPRIRWTDDHRLTVEKIDRGHQRFRLLEIDTRSATVRSILDEKSSTFIWTTHGPQVPITTYLDDSSEMIYASERDGWRHLYLIDLDEGVMRGQITSGSWVVRSIDRIDEEARQIWFAASGRTAGEDPYLLHHYRVNFDGSGLVELSPGNGQHQLRYSPTRKYYIDTYSRVDQPPIHELRRSLDGSLVCDLERADVTRLVESGWQSPEVVMAKGRDGETEIWGLLCKPRNFDPTRRYPVIEAIYAGPHDSHVPKSFQPTDWHRELTELGFIVVRIDGMGTANRSKAFHDVCWKNLKDAGFPDRIAWMRAAAKERPYLDLNRVGIYGTSAGGQNAAGALLFHGDFYRAAAAFCGCHDNRLDKASWNEQWMGYPVGPEYAASSNVEHAERLEGALMLMVGELDTNVPPESTLRFADALIEADKDFELLVMPGVGHSDGGAYGQRRMRDFFVRHLRPDAAAHESGARETTGPRAAKDDSRSSDAIEAADADRAPREKKAEPRDAESANRDDPSPEAEIDRAEAFRTHFAADQGSLQRFYSIRVSPTRVDRMQQFYAGWQSALAGLDTAGFSEREAATLERLSNDLEDAVSQLDDARHAYLLLQCHSGFSQSIIDLFESRQRVDPVDPMIAAGVCETLASAITESCAEIRDTDDACALPAAELKVLARAMEEVRDHFQKWFVFYDGYDPDFSWWVETPYRSAKQELDRYVDLLNLAVKEASQPGADGDDDAAGPGEETVSDGDDHRPDPLPDPESHVGVAVPDLEEMLTHHSGLIASRIDDYAQKLRRLRRGHRSDDPEDRAKAERELVERTLVDLDAMDFDELGRSDQVDWILLHNELRHRLAVGAANPEASSALPQDDSELKGTPVGRDRIRLELDAAMIVYEPDELIRIAEREYEWCRGEMVAASREMGLGDDWKAAVEKIKTLHVAPGEQPALIRSLAHESIAAVRDSDRISIPSIAEETFRMEMMSPQRQLINPFFTGGEVISVSFPTSSMKHTDKLQSMRGNNRMFSRATVHHELIPGHHLQGFITDRYHPHRARFYTPFWGEGWAVYWEMLLYDAGFARTPEERLGFLVWRAHRCARIIFSLRFHLGRMTPAECVDFLVENVGFDRNNATAEVRRSIGTSYSPLYQAGYMLGALQFRQLRAEVTGAGMMTEREFHDAVLRENYMPVELLRAYLTGQPLSRDFRASWRF